MTCREWTLMFRKALERRTWLDVAIVDHLIYKQAKYSCKRSLEIIKRHLKEQEC